MTKCPLLDKINKVVLPLMDFKVTIKKREKFSGEVKILKIKQYTDILNYCFKVDISVKGLVCTNRSYWLSDEQIYERYIKCDEHQNSIFAKTNFRLTKDYEFLDKKQKTNMTQKIKYDIEDLIREKVRMIIGPVKNSYPSRVLIDKIKYL